MGWGSHLIPQLPLKGGSTGLGWAGLRCQAARERQGLGSELTPPPTPPHPPRVLAAWIWVCWASPGSTSFPRPGRLVPFKQMNGRRLTHREGRREALMKGQEGLAEKRCSSGETGGRGGGGGGAVP